MNKQTAEWHWLQVISMWEDIYKSYTRSIQSLFVLSNCQYDQSEAISQNRFNVYSSMKEIHFIFTLSETPHILLSAISDISTTHWIGSFTPITPNVPKNVPQMSFSLQRHVPSVSKYSYTRLHDSETLDLDLVRCPTNHVIHHTPPTCVSRSLPRQTQQISILLQTRSTTSRRHFDAPQCTWSHDHGHQSKYLPLPPGDLTCRISKYG